MGIWTLLTRAFNARPLGMPVPPNWLLLALFLLLGFLNPGLWIIGVGLELAYLLALVTNTRFQNLIAAESLSQKNQQAVLQTHQMIVQLDPADQKRFTTLQSRCQRILAEHQSDPSLRIQLDALGKLLYAYLRLLLARQSFKRILDELRNSASIDLKLKELRHQTESPAISPDLRSSLQSQIDILHQRQERHGEARDKLVFIDAELARIEQQVELVREALVVSTDPESLSRQVDQIGATLTGTTQWIRQQQNVLGQVDDVLSDPPPILLDPVPPPRARN